MPLCRLLSTSHLFGYRHANEAIRRWIRAVRLIILVHAFDRGFCNPALSKPLRQV